VGVTLKKLFGSAGYPNPYFSMSGLCMNISDTGVGLCLFCMISYLLGATVCLHDKEYHQCFEAIETPIKLPCKTGCVGMNHGKQIDDYLFASIMQYQLAGLNQMLAWKALENQ
jgi:hypothetical protein